MERREFVHRHVKTEQATGSGLELDCTPKRHDLRPLIHGALGQTYGPSDRRLVVLEMRENVGFEHTLESTAC